MGFAWHILTGEFPPVPGGVSDYTSLVAPGLAVEGHEVHVWTTDATGRLPATSSPAPGVTLHRFAPAWSPSAFQALSQEISAGALPRLVLVQYVPNAWGYRGVNFALGNWLLSRRRAGDRVWGMVHEPFYPFLLWDKPTRWLLAALHRQMMRQLLAACERAFVSIPAFETMIAPFAPRHSPPRFEWLPVPSNVPFVTSPAEVAEQRNRYCAEDGLLLGSFGTYGPYIKAPLRKLIPQVLKPTNRRFLLLGRGGPEFASELLAAQPELGGRIQASGGLSPRELSLVLQGMNLMIQPYPDGASTRRGSLMAGLSHGLPIVTNTGALSEPLWTETACVRTAPAGDVAGMAAACEALLASDEERRRLGDAAKCVYAEQFAVERTVERLLAAAR